MALIDNSRLNQNDKDNTRFKANYQNVNLKVFKDSQEVNIFNDNINILKTYNTDTQSTAGYSFTSLMPKGLLFFKSNTQNQNPLTFFYPIKFDLMNEKEFLNTFNLAFKYYTKNNNGTFLDYSTENLVNTEFDKSTLLFSRFAGYPRVIKNRSGILQLDYIYNNNDISKPYPLFQLDIQSSIRDLIRETITNYNIQNNQNIDIDNTTWIVYKTLNNKLIISNEKLCQFYNWVIMSKESALLNTTSSKILITNDLSVYKISDFFKKSTDELNEIFGDKKIFNNNKLYYSIILLNGAMAQEDITANINICCVPEFINRDNIPINLVDKILGYSGNQNAPIFFIKDLIDNGYSVLHPCDELNNMTLNYFTSINNTLASITNTLDGDYYPTKQINLQDTQSIPLITLKDITNFNIENYSYLFTTYANKLQSSGWQYISDNIFDIDILNFKILPILNLRTGDYSYYLTIKGSDKNLLIYPIPLDMFQDTNLYHHLIPKVVNNELTFDYYSFSKLDSLSYTTPRDNNTDTLCKLGVKQLIISPTIERTKNNQTIQYYNKQDTTKSQQITHTSGNYSNGIGVVGLNIIDKTKNPILLEDYNKTWNETTDSRNFVNLDNILDIQAFNWLSNNKSNNTITNKGENDLTYSTNKSYNDLLNTINNTQSTDKSKILVDSKLFFIREMFNNAPIYIVDKRISESLGFNYLDYLPPMCIFFETDSLYNFDENGKITSTISICGDVDDRSGTTINGKFMVQPENLFNLLQISKLGVKGLTSDCSFLVNYSTTLDINTFYSINFNINITTTEIDIFYPNSVYNFFSSIPLIQKSFMKLSINLNSWNMQQDEDNYYYNDICETLAYSLTEEQLIKLGYSLYNLTPEQYYNSTQQYINNLQNSNLYSSSNVVGYPFKTYSNYNDLTQQINTDIKNKKISTIQNNEISLTLDNNPNGIKIQRLFNLSNSTISSNIFNNTITGNNIQNNFVTPNNDNYLSMNGRLNRIFTGEERDYNPFMSNTKDTFDGIDPNNSYMFNYQGYYKFANLFKTMNGTIAPIRDFRFNPNLIYSSLEHMILMSSEIPDYHFTLIPNSQLLDDAKLLYSFITNNINNGLLDKTSFTKLMITNNIPEHLVFFKMANKLLYIPFATIYHILPRRSLINTANQFPIDENGYLDFSSINFNNKYNNWLGSDGLSYELLFMLNSFQYVDGYFFNNTSHNMIEDQISSDRYTLTSTNTKATINIYPGTENSYSVINSSVTNNTFISATSVNNGLDISISNDNYSTNLEVNSNNNYSNMLGDAVLIKILNNKTKIHSYYYIPIQDMAKSNNANTNLYNPFSMVYCSVNNYKQFRQTIILESYDNDYTTYTTAQLKALITFDSSSSNYLMIDDDFGTGIITQKLGDNGSRVQFTLKLNPSISIYSMQYLMFTYNVAGLPSGLALQFYDISGWNSNNLVNKAIPVLPNDINNYKNPLFSFGTLIENFNYISDIQYTNIDYLMAQSTGNLFGNIKYVLLNNLYNIEYKVQDVAGKNELLVNSEENRNITLNYLNKDYRLINTINNYDTNLLTPNNTDLEFKYYDININNAYYRYEIAGMNIQDYCLNNNIPMYYSNDLYNDTGSEYYLDLSVYTNECILIFKSTDTLEVKDNKLYINSGTTYTPFGLIIAKDSNTIAYEYIPLKLINYDWQFFFINSNSNSNSNSNTQDNSQNNTQDKTNLNPTPTIDPLPQEENSNIGQTDNIINIPSSNIISETINVPYSTATYDGGEVTVVSKSADTSNVKYWNGATQSQIFNYGSDSTLKDLFNNCVDSITISTISGILTQFSNLVIYRMPQDIYAYIDRVLQVNGMTNDYGDVKTIIFNNNNLLINFNNSTITYYPYLYTNNGLIALFGNNNSQYIRVYSLTFSNKIITDTSGKYTLYNDNNLNSIKLNKTETTLPLSVKSFNIVWAKTQTDKNVIIEAISATTIPDININDYINTSYTDSNNIRTYLFNINQDNIQDNINGILISEFILIYPKTYKQDLTKNNNVLTFNIYGIIRDMYGNDIFNNYNEDELQSYSSQNNISYTNTKVI